MAPSCQDERPCSVTICSLTLVASRRPPRLSATPSVPVPRALRPIDRARTPGKRTVGEVVTGQPQETAVLEPAQLSQPRRHRLHPLAAARAAAGSVARTAARQPPLSLAAALLPPLLLLRVLPVLVPWLAHGGWARARGAGAARRPALVWFRSDLRLHDHDALTAANEACSSLLPVYVFDPREYSKSPSGFHKTGPHHACFVLEAVAELRTRLRSLGSDLIIRVGRPEDVLPQMAAQIGGDGGADVYCHSQVASEDAASEARVAAALRRSSDGARLRSSWGGTLLHVDDLPFAAQRTPACYADFRAQVASARVRAALPAPSALKALPAGTSLSVEPGPVPTLHDLGYGPDALAALNLPGRPGRGGAGGGGGGGVGGMMRRAVTLAGGEGEALRHMRAFVNGLPGGVGAAGGSGSGASSGASGSAFSCQVSPWLATGCLSPRLMYQEVMARGGGGGTSGTGNGLQQCGGGRAAGSQEGAQPSASASAGGSGAAGGSNGEAPGAWLVFELVWRDFFAFVTYKHTRGELHGRGKDRRGGDATSSCSGVPYPAVAAA